MNEQKMIPIGDIVVPPDRGRKDFSHVLQLKESIKENGLINPITVRDAVDGKYILMAGECRLRAMQILAWTLVPCTIWEKCGELTQRCVELEENVARKALEWPEKIGIIEEIDRLRRVVHGSKAKGSGDGDKGWTIGKTAATVGQGASITQKQVKFAKDLRENPVIAKGLEKLPMVAAMKEFTRRKEGERVQRLKKSGRLKIIHGFSHVSCIEGFQGVKDGSVDLVLSDPPYGLREIEEGRGKRSGKEVYKNLVGDTDNLCPAEASNLMLKVVPEIVRVLKPSGWVYLFCSYDFSLTLMSLLKSRDIIISPTPIIWDKERTSRGFTGYSNPNSYEMIVYGRKPPGKKRLAGDMGRDIVRCKTVSREKRKHPFQKPLRLLGAIIKETTRIGGMVLDPFAGSGATLVAAKRTGRSSKGFEIDEKNYNTALMWLTQEKVVVR